MSQERNGRHPMDLSNKYISDAENVMTFDMPSCGGCSTCELACSFHHTGEFVPAVSSLKIIAKEDGHGYQVLMLSSKVAKRAFLKICSQLIQVLTNRKMVNSDF